MFSKFVFVSVARRRLERLAQQLAEICIPRIRSQIALRQPAIEGAVANGYVRAWASLAIHEVTATDPLPGLTEAQWRELIELAVGRVVEAELIPVRASACRVWRKAA